MVKSTYEVKDEQGEIKMTVSFEGAGSITPEVFFRCVSQVMREHPELGGKDSQEHKDELELKELRKKNRDMLNQKEYSRLRELEEARTRSATSRD